MPAQNQVFHYLTSQQVTFSCITLSTPPVQTDIAPHSDRLRLIISQNLDRLHPATQTLTDSDIFLTLLRVLIISSVTLPLPDLTHIDNYRIAYPTLQALIRTRPPTHTFTHLPQYTPLNRQASSTYLMSQSNQITALKNSITVFKDQLTFSGFNRSTRITDSLRSIYLHCLQLNVRNPQAPINVNPNAETSTPTDFTGCNLVTRQGPLNLLTVPSLDLLSIVEPQTFNSWLPTRIDLQTDKRFRPNEILYQFNSEMKLIIPACVTAFPARRHNPPSSEEILLFLVTITANHQPEYFELFPFKEIFYQEERPLAILLAHSTNLDLPMATWLSSPHCPRFTLHSREVPLMITLACMALTIAAVYERNRDHCLLNSIPGHYISKFISPELCERYQTILRFQHQCDRTGTGSAAFRVFTLMCTTLEVQNHEAPDHVDQHDYISHFIMSDVHTGLLDLLRPDPSSRWATQLLHSEPRRSPHPFTTADMLTYVTFLYLRFFCIVLIPHARQFIFFTKNKKTNFIE